MSTYSWQGASGRWYEFEVARAARAWEPLGGVYMFVKPKEPNADWGRADQPVFGQNRRFLHHAGAA
ncbi:MAG: hypothetical protein NVV62_11585 [Terricaulis sp.]|nr:hypothetical protein [Terricaulis sp.]